MRTRRRRPTVVVPLLSCCGLAAAAVPAPTAGAAVEFCQVDDFQWPWIADTGYTGWVYLGGPETTVNNSVYFNNPEFNSLVTKMMQMPLGDERTRMDLRVQEIAAQEVPWIFLAGRALCLARQDCGGAPGPGPG